MRALFLGLLTACTGPATDDAPTTDTAPPAADTELGARVYADRCAVCHGVSGGGGSGPAMTDAVPGLTDAEIRAVIRNGGVRMPAFEALSVEEVAGVVAWLRAEFGG